MPKVEKGKSHNHGWKIAEHHRGKLLGPNSWEAILNQRKVRLSKKADKLKVPVESLPEYFTTPLMIAISLGTNAGNLAATARDLRVPINMIRYYDPRRKLKMVN